MSTDWKKIKFGDCAEKVSSAVQPDKIDPAVPYIGLEHIIENGLQISGHSVAAEATSTKTRFSQGDILFGKLRPYFRKVVRPNFDGICSTDIWAVKAKPGIDQRFLFYRMASQEFIDKSMGASTGTRMPRADWGYLSNWEIPIPPIYQQRKIASILGAFDDKIAVNQRINATLEAMARALFQSWFVDFDPVRAKVDGIQPIGLNDATANLFPKAFQDSTLGHIPHGWEIRSLDKTADYLNGLALQKYPPGDGPTFPVIKIAQLRKGDVIGADRCNTELPQQYVVEDGDVLFSWSGSLEVELWCGGTGALNQHLFKVTSQEFPKWFYYLWTLYHLDEFRLIAASKATTMGHIQRSHITDAKVVVPPRDLLVVMTQTMSPIIDQLIANKIQSRTLAALRDTLLPKLMSGELSVEKLQP
jgi:type I restriction enzyme S subunit